MKLLVITDSYPPHHSGGYELRSSNILDDLHKRGHNILILTTKCPQKHCDMHIGERRIFRELHKGNSTESLGKRIFFEYQDIKFIHHAITDFKPDLIYLFHVFNITRAMYPYLAECKIPIVLDEGGIGYSYSYFHRGPWYRLVEYESKYKINNIIKLFLVLIINRISKNLLKTKWEWPEKIRVYFNSNLNWKNAQSAGLDVKEFPVIHSGINTEQFLYKPRLRLGRQIQILVPGRIEARKGQLDSISVLALLIELNIDTRLVIVGKNNSNSYLKELKKKINSQNLENRVEILPMVDHENLVRYYQESDICFFASYAKTGLSRVPLEAMASGCLLFTYGNEGSDEIIKDNETGFIIPEGNIEMIINIIQELLKDQRRYQKIICTARKSVEEHHSIDLYIDKIELFLQKAIDEF